MARSLTSYPQPPTSPACHPLLLHRLPILTRPSSESRYDRLAWNFSLTFPLLATLSHSYWDAAANNWAFDYNGYYATYGYPQQGSAGGASSSAYPASSATVAPTNNIFASAAPATSSSSSAAAGGAAQTAEEKRRKAITGGARDAQGNALAGSLKRGEHRTTVIRKGPNGDYEVSSTAARCERNSKLTVVYPMLSRSRIPPFSNGIPLTNVSSLVTWATM